MQLAILELTWAEKADPGTLQPDLNHSSSSLTSLEGGFLSLSVFKADAPGY